jgi:hypothetical protein
MTDVVNFGKYRGQPIEILASDRGYCDWLMAQPWFRERHQNLYTVIINHYQQPADTPEHNALQALFLAPDYREAFLDLVDLDWTATHWGWHCDRLRNDLGRWEEAVANAEREVAEAQERERAAGRDPTTERTGWYFGKSAEQTLANAREQLAQAQAQDDAMTLHTRAVFEEGNIDVCIGADLYADAARKNHLRSTSLNIEVKPTVGDDYPSVLRQMNRASVTMGPAKYLFLEAYTGVGVTEAQLRQIFKASGKRVVFRHEVDARLAHLAEDVE